MKRMRRLSMESLEQRIVLDGVGPHDPPGTPQWESVIVALNEDVGDPTAVARGAVKAHGGQLGHIYQHAVKGFSAQLPGAALQALLKNPQVKRIEPDLTMQAFAQLVPTGIDRIDADLNSVARIDGNDERVDVDIAILDSGIDGDHPDLNVFRGYNATNGPASRWNDGFGHGTHVAGTVAALDNGVGVVGVAPGARLWAVKVLGNNGSGRLSDIIEGIDWVTANADEIEIANMSLGGQGVSNTYHQAIQASVNAGVVYVVASGNDYRDILGGDFEFGTSDDTIPAAYPEVATISAIADTDGRPGGLGSETNYADFFGNYADDTYADFSNFSNSDPGNNSWYDTNNKVTSPGLGIDLMMPGVDIYSTYKDGGYAVSSGTSMASPHAAGLAALYIAENVTSKPAGWPLNDTDVYGIRQALINEGKPWRSEEGLGLITGSNPDSPDKHEENLGWAGPSGPVDNPPSVTITGPLSGTTVSGTVTVTADASDDDVVTQVEFFVGVASIGVDSDGSDGWSADWDTASYSDGSYTVTAMATDTAPQTASDSVSVTVDNTAAATMHVSDLDGTSDSVNRRKWAATVTATVRDSNGIPVPNATVQGTWSNGVSSTASTDGSGLATVYSGNVDSRVTSVMFTVNNIAHASLSYDPNANTDPDVPADSNGMAIVVFQDGSTAPPPSLLAARGVKSASPGETLTQDVAEVAATQAVALWSQHLVRALPQEIYVHVADLPKGTLGWAYGDTIALDVNANGAGWHADLNSPGSGQVDLLTVVSHELGHLLGYEHSADVNNVMAANLGSGTLRLPGYSQSAMPSATILDPLSSTGFGDLDDREEEPSALANVELVAIPPTPSVADRPQRTGRAADARLLDEATDEASQLIDDELLDLLAQAGD